MKLQQVLWLVCKITSITFYTYLIRIACQGISHVTINYCTKFQHSNVRTVKPVFVSGLHFMQKWIASISYPTNFQPIALVFFLFLLVHSTRSFKWCQNVFRISNNTYFLLLTLGDQHVLHSMFFRHLKFASNKCMHTKQIFAAP